jgi:putative MATE family efflux protein
VSEAEPVPTRGNGTEPDSTWELSRRIFAMSWPNIVYAVLDQMLFLVTIWLVARLGEAAIGAVGLSFRIMILVATFSFALSAGAMPFIGQAFGARDLGQVRHLASQTLRGMVAIGLVLSPVLYLVARPALRWSGAAGEVETLGVTYMQAMAMGQVFMFLNFTVVALFRAVGQVRTPLVLVVGMNLLNVPLTWVLMVGWEPLIPALGIAGAAWGSIVSRALGAGVGWLIWERRTGRYPRVASGLFDWPVLRRILGVGLPFTGMSLARMGAALVFVVIFARLGTVTLAAATLANQVRFMLIMPALMIQTALMTLVSHSLGAGHFDRARRYAWQTQLWGGLLMGAVTVLLIVLARPVAEALCALRPLDEPDLVEQTLAMMRIALYGVFLSTAAIIFAGALNGGGDVVYPFVFTVVSEWVVMLPCALLIRGHTDNPTLIWWAGVLSPAVLVVLYYWRFRQGRWLRRL